LPPPKDDEDSRLALLQLLRRLMTSMLLDVTTIEITKVAKDLLDSVRKKARTGHQLAQSSALAALSNLGDDEQSEPEPAPDEDESSSAASGDDDDEIERKTKDEPAAAANSAAAAKAAAVRPKNETSATVSKKDDSTTGSAGKFSPGASFTIL